MTHDNLTKYYYFIVDKYMNNSFLICDMTSKYFLCPILKLNAPWDLKKGSIAPDD